jgi:hypothetical protein
MKMAISFISGVVVCCLIIFGVRTVIPTDAATAGANSESDNNTLSLVNLLPNIEEIYQTALTEPFIKAGYKITDPDIAEYYNGLMDKTGLTSTSSAE